jgi:hypothetical protein
MDISKHAKMGLAPSKSNPKFISRERYINLIQHCLIKAIHSNSTVHVIVKTKLVTHQFSIKNKHAATHMPSSYPTKCTLQGGCVGLLGLSWAPTFINLSDNHV